MTFPTLTTPRLNLRKPQMSDAGPMAAYMKQGRVQQYIPNIPVEEYSLEDAKDHLSSVRDAYKRTEKIVWAIHHDADDTFIGLINIHDIDTHNLKGTLAYHLDPAYWEQGYMTESLKAVITWGFNDLNLHRLEAETAIQNKASRSLLESIGFTEEGTKRSNLLIRDTYHDTTLYSLLETEWRQ